MTTIHLGISTCPNDTFAFHGLMNRKVSWRGLDFNIELIDIQQLNDRLFQGDFDVAKTSFHAALLLSDQTVVLPSGSALGFGVGPLLLSARAGKIPQHHGQVTLCPGEHTTAALLYRLMYPDSTQIRHVVFSQIMPDLKSAQADSGSAFMRDDLPGRMKGWALWRTWGLAGNMKPEAHCRWVES